MTTNISSEYLPTSPTSPSSNGNGKPLKPTDQAVKAIRRWGQREPGERHPNFVRRLLEDERRLLNLPNVTHGMVTLWTWIKTASLLPNVHGSDGNGGWQVSLRTLSKLVRADEHSVVFWRDTLVKCEFLLVQKITSFRTVPNLKYYLRSVLTDERVTELEMGSPMVLGPSEPMWIGPSEPGGKEPSEPGVKEPSRPQGQSTAVTMVREQVVPMVQCHDSTVPLYKMRDGGYGLEPPPPLGSGSGEANNLIPRFEPIPEDKWESSLKWMLKECEAELKSIPTKHSTTQKVFLCAYKVQTLEQLAGWLEKSAKPDDLARAAEHRQSIADLKEDPSSYSERQVLTPLGREIKAAWEARREEIRRRLMGVR